MSINMWKAEVTRGCYFGLLRDGLVSRGLTVIEGVCVDTTPGDSAREVPELVERRALRRNNDDHDELVYGKKTHCALTEALESSVHGCMVSVVFIVPLWTIRT